MTLPFVRVHETHEAMYEGAARMFMEVIRRAIADHGLAHIALSGGSTPRGLYGQLTQLPSRDAPCWENVRFYFSDERTVAPDHEDSNFGLAHRHLFEPLAIPCTSILRLQGEIDPVEAALRAERDIAQAFRITRESPPPALDLILLGLGADGHTASLFPHTSALSESSRWIVANYVPKLQSWRLTMTPCLINAARNVLFLATGADKAAAVASVIQGPMDANTFPAQLICPKAGCLYWILDKPAAAQLPDGD